MAILNGVLKKLSGSVGNLTFARLNGQTVVKEKVEKKATPVRTLAQMTRRMQWANIINLWRQFNGNLHPSFENKASSVSDYNEFVSANIGIVPVYLTKSMATEGGCVVAGYQVTRGSMPSVRVYDAAGDVPATDIELGDITLSNATTVAEFSQAVIDNNVAYANGDEITSFLVNQKENSETGTPYVNVLAQQITLDTSDTTTKLRDVVDASTFSVADNRLGCASTIEGAVTWVHSRKTSSGTKVSTQRLTVYNDLLSQYQSSAALEKAYLSYGGLNTEQYLTPNSES